MRTIYVLLTVVAVGIVLLGASPGYASMQDDVDQAATIMASQEGTCDETP